MSCALREKDIGKLDISSPSDSDKVVTRSLRLPDGKSYDVEVYNLTSLKSDEVHKGPAVIETAHTSIIIDNNSSYSRTAAGSLLVDIQ